jgi:aerobic-type carbon monoxide dehydrogenase small subunit (CoxS/CutS family)
VIQSWEKLEVSQSDYCQPGQITSAMALLKQTPVSSDDQINMAMSGNICRCGTCRRTYLHGLVAGLDEQGNVIAWCA